MLQFAKQLCKTGKFIRFYSQAMRRKCYENKCIKKEIATQNIHILDICYMQQYQICREENNNRAATTNNLLRSL